MIVLSEREPENPFYLQWQTKYCAGLTTMPCPSEQYAFDAADSVRRNGFGEPVILPTRRIVAPMQAVRS